MKRYGSADKRSASSTAFATDAAFEKKLITDYFTLNKEYTAQTSSSAPPLQNSSPQQTFLDLGQRNFLFRECPGCGMKYDSSFANEVRLHNRFHRIPTAGMEIKFGAKDIIGRLGSHVAITAPPNRRQELMDLVESELNAVKLTGNESVYAVIEGKGRLCSVAITEPDPAFLKLSRIWTRKDKRRQGLASFLLNSILSYENKPKEKVQLSSPTPTGNLFAQAFFGEEHYSLYSK